ncbi:hypothetical protein BDZ85DRAFT_298292 [Elsinoe ampelina]|uniref:Uncharacterized protein n=1 Tax=Elsinoe ampelina TaxID=302913 RepID=A0A6A6G3C3_9PEZI|nr:hypothetical protein BDZ85DRAFT_298292 [Elsinoe ampelina]
MPPKRKKATKKTSSPTSNPGQASANPQPPTTMTLNPAWPIFTRDIEDDTVTVPSVSGSLRDSGIRRRFDGEARKCYLLDLPPEVRMMIYDCLKTTNTNNVYFRYPSGEGWVEMVGRTFGWVNSIHASTSKHSSSETMRKHHFLLLAASCNFFRDELTTLGLINAVVRLETEATLTFQRATIAKRILPGGLGNVLQCLQVVIFAGPGFGKTFHYLMADLELGARLQSFHIYLQLYDGHMSGDAFKDQVTYFLDTWKSLLCSCHIIFEVIRFVPDRFIDTMIKIFDAEKQRITLRNILKPEEQTALFDRMTHLTQLMRTGQSVGIIGI